VSAQVVLLVEDDPALRTLTARALQQNGYRVRTAVSGPEMWAAFDGGPVDLVLLDIMLPGTSGIDLCRMIRQKSDVPIIFVSARGEETDRVVGLELGADDFLPKPFGTRELIARIRAVLRRGRLEGRHGGERVGSVRFDGWTGDIPRRQLVSPTGADIELTGAEFDLLTAFLDQPQRVISRERLIELSRNRLGDASDRSVDVLVSRLRRKLRDTAGEALIATAPGFGYRLTVPVESL